MRVPTANLSATSLLIVGLLAAAPSAAVLPWTGARTFQQAPKALSGDWTADTRQSWTGDDGQPRVQFNLRTEAGDSRWGFGIRAGDLQGLPAAALSGVASDVRFTWTREAGTFRFSGSFDNGRGAGRYTFEPSSTFLSTMSGLGYRSLTGEDALRLAVIDVTSAYVRDLGQAGYRDLPLEQLTRMRIHKVMPEYIGEMKALGYASLSADDLVRMRIHRVEPDFVRGLRTRGYSGLTAEDLVKMRIHKVSLEDIDRVQGAGTWRARHRGPGAVPHPPRDAGVRPRDARRRLCLADGGAAGPDAHSQSGRAVHQGRPRRRLRDDHALRRSGPGDPRPPLYAGEEAIGTGSRD